MLTEGLNGLLPVCKCIGKLMQRRYILKGSEYVIDPEKIGYETCAYIGIYLKDPESFDSVTKQYYRQLSAEEAATFGFTSPTIRKQERRISQ